MHVLGSSCFGLFFPPCFSYIEKVGTTICNRCHSSSPLASLEYRTNSVLLYFATRSFEPKVPSKLKYWKCSSLEDFIH
ncbi:hypothetical protein BT93_H3469 [Corymbia citriodora subsp. variegata]|nr:hypothetical protein BT93_H3469 [Corymbia citriodora subsp. variegata]